MFNVIFKKTILFSLALLVSGIAPSLYAPRRRRIKKRGGTGTPARIKAPGAILGLIRRRSFRDVFATLEAHKGTFITSLRKHRAREARRVDPNPDILLHNVICSAGRRARDGSYHKLSEVTRVVKFLLEDIGVDVNAEGNDHLQRTPLLALSRVIEGTPVHVDTNSDPRRLTTVWVRAILGLLLENGANLEDFSRGRSYHKKNIIYWLMEDIGLPGRTYLLDYVLRESTQRKNCLYGALDEAVDVLVADRIGDLMTLCLSEPQSYIKLALVLLAKGRLDPAVIALLPGVLVEILNT